MARPRKTGLDYFPLDVDFFDDEKIVAISGEFGIKGEITVIKLLCAVYRNGYFIEWNEMLKFKLVKSLPGVSAELLEQILARLIKWRFFDKKLFDSAKVITSTGIQKRYFEAAKFRIQDIEAPYLLVEKPENYAKEKVSQQETQVSQQKNQVSQQKTTQIKRNKIKINIPPSNPPKGGSGGGGNIFFYDLLVYEDIKEILKGIDSAPKPGESDFWKIVRLCSTVENRDIAISLIREWSNAPTSQPFYIIIQKLQSMESNGLIHPPYNHTDFSCFLWLYKYLSKDNAETIISEVIKNKDLISVLHNCKFSFEQSKEKITCPENFILSKFR